MLREPRRFVAGGRCEVRIDGDFDEVGPEDVGDGLDEDGERRGSRGELVRREIAEQTAHERPVVDFADYVVIGALGGSGFLFLLFGLLFGHRFILEGARRAGDSGLHERIEVWGFIPIRRRSAFTFRCRFAGQNAASAISRLE